MGTADTLWRFMQFMVYGEIVIGAQPPSSSVSALLHTTTSLLPQSSPSLTEAPDLDLVTRDNILIRAAND